MNNILVVIKDLDDETFLLDKALRFSPESLCVVMVNPVGADENTVSKKICDYITKKELAQTKADVKFFYEIDEKVSADFLVDLSNSCSSDLIILMKPEIVDELQGLDLVKSLLRSSIKAKILMARRKKWSAPPNVMCTVDIGSDDESQMELDKLVFEYSKNFLKDTLLANLHLATVIGISRVSEELDIVDASSVLQKKGQQYKDKLSVLDESQAVNASKILVAAGVPSKEICSLAKKQKIDLVVIGNVGRKGLKGMVIGNTAEKILKNISSDVLVVNGKLPL